MADILRLKRYEPLKVTTDNALDVDSVILDMARHIRKYRADSKRKK